MNKVMIFHKDKNGERTTPVMANVETGFMIVDGARVKIEKVDLPNYKFKVRLY